MMMSNPEDKMFQNLLSDYAADVPDDGFTRRVIATIVAKNTHMARIKYRIIASAIVLGGAIAATQVPAFITLASGLTLPRLTMPNPSPYLTVGVLAVFAFMLWAILDNKGSEVI